MVKKDQDQKNNITLIKNYKLRKSFNKVIKISEPRKLEIQKAIEAEKYAKKQGITTDEYLKLFEYYEQNPSILRKARKNSLVKYAISSIAGTAFLTTVGGLTFNYLSQRKSEAEKYQQEVLTKYFDEIK